MMRFSIVLISFVCNGLWPSLAESNIGKAVTVHRSGITLSVGRDGTYSLDSDRLEVLVAENANIDTLIENMIPELLKVQPTDSARAWVRKEHKLWLKERSKQCRREARTVPRDRRSVREQGCHKWAGLWRLEELLMRYDELAPK